MGLEVKAARCGGSPQTLPRGVSPWQDLPVVATAVGFRVHRAEWEFVHEGETRLHWVYAIAIFVGSIAQSYPVVLLVKLKLSKLKLSILKLFIENSRNISLDEHKSLLQITLILVHSYFISPDAQRLWFT
jgi:hypothetical protein